MQEDLFVTHHTTVLAFAFSQSLLDLYDEIDELAFNILSRAIEKSRPFPFINRINSIPKEK